MTDQRGGVVLKTGKIGRVNVLRQQLIAPGEMINTQIDGDVKIEATRERESLRINGHLATFLTPVRWLDPNWTQYITEGEDTAVSLATQSRTKLSNIGIGADDPLGTTVPSFWKEAVLRIYNEWYKWPEDADVTTWTGDGRVAVPLQAAWNRCRYDVTPGDASDYQAAVVSNTLDVRTLAETQAKFRSAMEREILSYGRYMEMIGEMFGADGSREVDKVPMMVDQTEVGVRPREIPATDSAGLGDWQSIYDFAVNHRIGGIVAPEHCVLTYVLCMRFAPVIEGRNPLSVDDMEWADQVGDPEILRNKMPQSVRVKDVVTSSSTTALGYLPAGWRWKTGWDVIGTRIDESDSFPMMNFPTTQAEAKDATRIKDAFRSQAFGDYIVDLYFREESRNLHGTGLESYFSGMTGAGSDATFPKQGKML
jgi:hypothetical protein